MKRKKWKVKMLGLILAMLTAYFVTGGYILSGIGPREFPLFCSCLALLLFELMFFGLSICTVGICYVGVKGLLHHIQDNFTLVKKKEVEE